MLPDVAGGRTPLHIPSDPAVRPSPHPPAPSAVGPPRSNDASRSSSAVTDCPRRSSSGTGHHPGGSINDHPASPVFSSTRATRAVCRATKPHARAVLPPALRSEDREEDDQLCGEPPSPASGAAAAKVLAGARRRPTCAKPGAPAAYPGAGHPGPAASDAPAPVE